MVTNKHKVKCLKALNVGEEKPMSAQTQVMAIVTMGTPPNISMVTHIFFLPTKDVASSRKVSTTNVYLLGWSANTHRVYRRTIPKVPVESKK